MATYLGFDPTAKDDYLFISYNSEDCDRISKVLQGLPENDVPLWYDYGIEYGSVAHLWEIRGSSPVD